MSRKLCLRMSEAAEFAIKIYENSAAGTTFLCDLARFEIYFSYTSRDFFVNQLSIAVPRQGPVLGSIVGLCKRCESYKPDVFPHDLYDSQH